MSGESCPSISLQSNMLSSIHAFILQALTIMAVSSSTFAQNLPDIKTVPLDLEVPAMVDASPAAGKRVRVTSPEYKDTEVHHTLYLPTDWKAGGRYPVIVEYAGNGPFKNKFGDICSGKVEDCNLGYGISGGKGVIWVCLPYISEDGQLSPLIPNS